MKKVFLDANALIDEVGKPPHGSVFARLIDLIDSEQIRMVTTNVTMAEAARKHTSRDFKEMKCICSPKLRHLVEETIDTEFPAVTEKQLWEALREKYSSLMENVFKIMNTKLLKIKDANANNVFWDYFNECGFFAAGGGKKHQFPDAFVFERLKKEASRSEPIIIVSKDKDFVQPVNDQKHIYLVKSLPDLFGELGLKLEDPDIAQFLAENHNEIERIVSDELLNRELQGNLENSEITEIEVIEVNIDNTIAFKSADEKGPILVAGSFYVLTMVSFTHLQRITRHDPMDIDIVENNNIIELPIDVSLSIAVDDNGNPTEIETLEFRNDRFANVTLDPYEHDWLQY